MSKLSIIVKKNEKISLLHLDINDIMENGIDIRLCRSVEVYVCV
jgi:hypothetical protein